MSNRNLFYLVMMLLGFLVAGCSNDGSDASTNTQLSGVAASGAPLVGTVYLKDSSTPAKEISAPIAADGSFSFNLDGLTAPYLLKAVGSANGRNITLYSFASTPGIANINPLANLSLADAYGNTDLATLYATPSQPAMQAILLKLTNAVVAIQAALQPTLTKLGATNTNFITDPYVANRQGLDLLFDMVDFSAISDVVTIVDRTDNSSKQFCLSDINSTVLNFIAIPIPAPGSVAIMPDNKTLGPNTESTFTAIISGARSQQVAWSVLEEGGGTITADGLYRAPQVPGIYHVKAASSVDSSKSAIATVTVRQKNVFTLVPSGVGVYEFLGTDLVNVVSAQLRISYNSSILGNPRVTIGELATGARLTTDSTVAGTLIVTIGGKLLSGTGSLATINFDVLSPSAGGIIRSATFAASEGVPPATPIPCQNTGAIPIPASTGAVAAPN